MELLLVRHGETDWNVQRKIQGSTDIPLNENGKRQAIDLGEHLRKEKVRIHKIYTSKMIRAKETAQIIGSILSVPVVEVEGLQEMNLGDWEGRTWEEIPKLYPKEYEEWYENRRYTKTPNGESYQEVVERMVDMLQSIINQEKEDVLVVTHGADILSLLALLDHVDFREMTQKYRVTNATVHRINGESIRNCEIRV